MTNGDDRDGETGRYLDTVDPEALVADEQLRPTPEQHEQLKNRLHGDRFTTIKRSERRYLVIGRGGEDGPGQRRKDVCKRLDDRISATAFRLEDFGFTGDELELWVPAFDILSQMATHIVGIVEDYNGGHVWELGFLYRYQTTVRNVLWLLKRVYDGDEEMREHYDNGMAASHLAALEKAADDRVIEWAEPADIPAAVESIP